jgi:hypothetical protein
MVKMLIVESVMKQENLNLNVEVVMVVNVNVVNSIIYLIDNIVIYVDS